MRNKGIAYRRMLASFSLVFAIPLCLVFAFYFFSNRVIEKQIEASNDNFVRTIQSTCDRELQYYQNVLTQLSMEEHIEEIAGQDALNRENQVSATKLMTSISEIRASISLLGNECTDIFVYFPGVDRVFSNRAKGSVRFDVYAKEFLSDDPSERETMKSYLSTYTKSGLTGAIADKMGGEMVLITYCSERVGDDSRATLGVWLDIDALVHRIASVEWQHGYDWLIADSNGTIVKGALNDYRVGETLNFETLSKEKYMVYTIQSDESGWMYVLMMPKEVVQSSAMQLRIYFTLSIILCVAIACVLIRKAIMLNYAPLQNILKAFHTQNDAPDNHKNEFQFLDSQIRSLVNAKADMESDISQSKKSLMQWSLINMLVRPYDRSGESRVKDWESHVQSFAKGDNLVLIVKERTDNARNEEDQLPDTTKRFIMENVFLERLGELLRCAMVELEGNQVLVLNDDAIGAKMDRIREIIFELQNFVSDKFEFSVAVSAGAVHTGLEGLHKSYMEARETEDFIPILDQDFMTYEEIKDKTLHRYHYSFQSEKRISAAVLNDNAGLAIALIHKVIDSSRTDNQTSPGILKYIIYDIFCTLLKTADEKGCIDRIHMLPPNLGIRSSEAEIKEQFSKTVESICDMEKTPAEVNPEKALCAKIMEYVQENYCDPCLNISQTAFHFHMSPASLSSIYKNETGKSLLMVINEIRMEKAIQYLKQGCSVVETAEKVGVPESSSFIRLFKKYIGMTPGQMKAHLHDEKRGAPSV